MRTCLLLFSLFLLSATLQAQDKTGYQMPPKVIADLIDAAPTPGLSVSPDHQWMLLMDQPGLPSIEEVSQPELRLAGLRINPQTNGQSRASFYTDIRLRNMNQVGEKSISGLPEKARISEVTWSPDSRYVAFLNTVTDGIELWLIDIGQEKARKLTQSRINDALRGSAFEWLSDSKHLLCKTVPADRGSAPAPPSVPSGPVIQSNEGDAAPVRTYQDMLQNPYDEALFSYYSTSELKQVNIQSGEASSFAKGIFRRIEPSPDGNYILLESIKKPFSYIIPYDGFTSEVNLFDRSGKLVRQLADLPAEENLPKGFNAVPTGPRSFTWRSDKPASLYWVEAQDDGDPKKEVEVRDKLFFLDAPFSGEPKEALSFSLRYGGVTWGTDDLAMASEYWRATRREITRIWHPGHPETEPEVLFDRSYEDRYGDPGSFETTTNRFGRRVLLTDTGNNLFLTGQGASPEGNRPFVDTFNPKTKETERLWRSEAPFYETPLFIMDPDKGIVVTRREANYEPPNYFFRNLKTHSITQLTNFPNPFESLTGVQKELVKFKRADGIDMTGTLYLPAGYDKEKDGPLPMLMWAYPREYKSADAASQVTGSPYSFIRTSWASPTLWVTRGYAIFDNVSMPIIGEGEEEPNETFVQQLQANAEAAINTVVDMGVAQRDKIGVGGHSYGAFMTANLLAHTDLFAAGIARSGAYNRTLTPFGFQSEERTYWETPETYYKMSPFNFADKIKGAHSYDPWHRR